MERVKVVLLREDERQSELLVVKVEVFWLLRRKIRLLEWLDDRVCTTPQQRGRVTAYVSV